MAPTMSRTTRQVLLCLATALKMRVSKGDVSGAFLQGREHQHDAYVIPTDEVCAALGIPAGSVTKLKKACHGLVDAPLEWFLRLSEYLASIRFTHCVTDPGCFKYVNSKGDLVGQDMWTTSCFVAAKNVRSGNKTGNLATGPVRSERSSHRTHSRWWLPAVSEPVYR